MPINANQCLVLKVKGILKSICSLKKKVLDLCVLLSRAGEESKELLRGFGDFIYHIHGR